MITTTRSRTVAWALIMLLGISSCQKETTGDTEKPTVSNLQVGENDTLYAGHAVHLEFDVLDNDRLSYYRLTIHPEEEHKRADQTSPWVFDSTFTEIEGLKNYTVHHHNIQVPNTAEPDHYHLHLMVADEQGNSLSINKDLLLLDSANYTGGHQE